MSHCVIRRYTGNPSELNVIRLISDTLVPRLRECAGLRPYRVAAALDAEADRLVAASV